MAAVGLLAALVVTSAAAAPPAATKAASAHARQRIAVKKRAPAKADPAPVVAAPDPSDDAARMLAWIAAEHDNGGLPYILIDKQAASLFMFDGKGTLVGYAPVLLGVGIGDDSSPGVGAKELSEIGPAERTTPAGRFVARFGRAFGRQRVLWVDYANSVALHAVLTTHKEEQRVERLLSPGPEDNRITFGCINVPTAFYTAKVSPLFRKKGGIVYILPDTKTLDDVFPRVRLLPYLKSASSASATEKGS